MSPSDTELIRRFVEQHADDAFAELVRRHVDLVYRAAFRRVGDAHLAEEVAQAVFTALAWKASTLVRHQTIVGWLHTATGFAAKELLRTDRRRRRHEQEAGTMHEISSHPAESAEWEQLRPVIDDVLAELNVRDREAVLLRFFANLSFADVGTALDVPENTARMRVARALDKLHSLLARRGMTSTSASLAAVLATQAAVASAPTTMAASITGAALASATAGTSAGAATTTIFMGLTKIQTGIALAAALALGAAFYEARLAGNLETQGTNIKAEIPVANARITALERELSVAQSERSALQEKIASPRGKNPGAVAAAPVAPPPGSQLEIIRDRYLQRRTVARSDPQYQRLQTELRKREIAKSYGPLFLHLNLSADQVEHFESIMAEHDLLVDDIEAVAEAKHIAVWDPQIDTLKAAANETLSAKMRELLGAADYAAYERNQRTANLRSSVIGTVAVALYATDTPISAAQADELTGILDLHTRVERDGSKNMSGLDWDPALTEAKRVLAPAQWKALEAMRAQSRWSDVLGNALGPMVGTQPPAKPADG